LVGRKDLGIVDPHALFPQQPRQQQITRRPRESIIPKRIYHGWSSKLLNQSRSGRVSFRAPTFVGNKLGKYFLNTGGWSDIFE
jgi:hypothetical protein